MTIHQEATNLIYHLPDKNVQLLVELMRAMLSPSTKDVQNTADPFKSANVSKRIGLGKGIINDLKDFDKWDSEIADLLEGTDI